MSFDITIGRQATAQPALFWSTVWDEAEQLGDWRVAPAGDPVNPGGLDASGQLASAVILSLFTDRRAPEGWRPEVADRRGWWGDAVAPEGEDPEETGSHLTDEIRVAGLMSGSPGKGEVGPTCHLHGVVL